jgi:uncharacterized protein (DUF486 family)
VSPLEKALSLYARTPEDPVVAGRIEPFMTFAWYGHLRNLGNKPWYIAAVASWSIALFEYLPQVPANRLGYTRFSLAQLESLLYMPQPIKLDWAGLGVLGAVYFMFR